MQNYALVVFDLVKTLLQSHPLPWKVLNIKGVQTVIATSTKTIILKTRDPAVASEVVIYANACHKHHRSAARALHG